MNTVVVVLIKRLISMKTLILVQGEKEKGQGMNIGEEKDKKGKKIQNS